MSCHRCCATNLTDRFPDIWQNKRRARLVADMGLTPEESLHQGALNAESDMTDFENIHFRYSY